MKKFLVASFVLAFSLQAADKMEYINIQETLDSALAKETLSGKISFSFGSKSGNGKVIAKDLVTNKKSNAAMRGHDGKIESCKRSFISALKQFEDRAMSIVKDLKTDLNDPSTPPQMKAQLKKEIDNYEKAMDTYFKESKKISNPKMIPAILQEFIYKKCGGGIKFKISELPYKHGFRSDTNKVTNSIIDGDYDNKSIINTKII